METVDIEIDTGEVRRELARRLPRSQLWIRREGLERTLDISFASLVRLADLIEQRTGVITVRVTFDPHMHARRAQFGFELAG